MKLKFGRVEQMWWRWSQAVLYWDGLWCGWWFRLLLLGLFLRLQPGPARPRSIYYAYFYLLICHLASYHSPLFVEIFGSTVDCIHWFGFFSSFTCFFFVSTTPVEPAFSHEIIILDAFKFLISSMFHSCFDIIMWSVILPLLR